MLKSSNQMCFYAAEMLEEMGFNKVETAPKSISMYYVHPLWPDAAVRVSDHGMPLRQRRSQARRLNVKVLRNITFTDTMKISSQMALDGTIANAIGFMIMERLSTYKRAQKHAKR